MAQGPAHTLATQQRQFVGTSLFRDESRLRSSVRGLRNLTSVFACLLLLVIYGCSGSSESESANSGGEFQSASSAKQELASSPVAPVATGIEMPTAGGQNVLPVAAKNPDQQVQPAVDLGTPEALMAEISRLRTAPLEVVMTPVAGQPGQFQETSLTLEQQEVERMRRLHQVIDLSHQIIAKTHADAQQEQIFNNAVSLLTDARMQLVMAGDADQEELLTRDADDLFKRDPTSFAAIDAGARTVQLAQSLSQLNSGNQEMVLTFSRRARLFAERFPQETSRAAVAVAMAARQCDHQGLAAEARLGYAVLRDKFPGTPFAEQSAGPLRRFELVGQILNEFEGESHDGGVVSLSQYRGQSVLIAFWSSASVFPDQLPEIERLVRSSGDRLTVLGVCLDQDVSGLETVLDKSSLAWKHIFYAAPNLRGLANPVAQFYGITRVPSYWLVDPQGVLKSISVDPTKPEEVMMLLK